MNIFRKIVPIMNPTDTFSHVIISVSQWRDTNYKETDYELWILPVVREVVDNVAITKGCPFESYRHLVAWGKRASKRAEREAMARSIQYINSMRTEEDSYIRELSNDEYESLIKDMVERGK